ncbi:MAG: hypothetical protein JKY66_07400 [Spongiibacteraceae bacterium]|nr:hypothetical protein [Spongiibacteraceae bacterium]
MSLEVAIKLNSLQVIREELNGALNQSANDFEAYLDDPQDIKRLNASGEKIAQVGGTFRLLEYPGSALVADEMAAVITVIAGSGTKATKTMIDALTHCYFILPRYIEYVALNKSELPILIIPYVNELRVCRKEPLLPEYHFYKNEISTQCSLTLDVSSQIEELLCSISRLRHMYQVGLLGIFKEPQSEFHYTLMARAVTRIVSLMGDHTSADTWQLASAVLECFGAKKLELTLNRRRLFAEIEKLMRVIVSQGEKGLDLLDTQSLKKRMVFMLMLSSYSSKAIDALRERYHMQSLGMNDDYIAAQRELMHGPSLDTIESVIKALKDELRNIKDILEIASQNDCIELEDLKLLQELVTKVADTLSLLNLLGPQETLLEQLKRMQEWGESLVDVGSAEFLETADSILYVESALSGLNRRELSVADLNEASIVARRKVIASSQLAEAQAAVLAEAQSSVALVKRAITSYVDSSFDSAHIANVATTLNTVRGGLHMLNYQRAAAVIKSCSDFMKSHISESDPAKQRHQLLETLPDALISLEYYLVEVESVGEGNEQILEVAEESLAALGFAVSAA